MRLFARSMVATLGVLLASNGQAAEPNFQLKLVGAEQPVWRGIPAEELSLGSGGMMYPAPNAAGLVVAVLTHALLMQASRSTIRATQQANADKVLEPYRLSIQELTGEELLNQALSHVPAASVERLKVAKVEIQPVFSMPPDQRFIILDNKLRWGGEGQNANERVVRVIAPYVDTTEPQVHWTKNSAENLKKEVALMVAHSVELSHLVPLADPKTHKTHRYQLGNMEKMERGTLLAQGCERIIIETLRGGLLSVPATATGTREGCINKPYGVDFNTTDSPVSPSLPPEVTSVGDSTPAAPASK